MQTETKEQALAVLKKSRKPLIERARYEAVRIAKETGQVHSRLVRAAMANQGFLNSPTLDDRWLGAVFNCSLFEKVGEHVVIDRQRNIHARPVPLWALKPEYRNVILDVPPDPVGF